MGPPKGKAAPVGKALPVDKPPAALEGERHLYFDRVEFEVRGGHGGDGALIRQRGGSKLKTGPGGGVELPDGGGRGGDVLLFVDPAVPDLMHLHGRKRVVAERGRDAAGYEQKKKGGQVAKLEGRADGKAAADGMDLRVPVPAGTFVRTKAGKVLGDLVKPGESLRVSVGAEGGPCLLSEASGAQGKKGSRGRRPPAQEEGLFELQSTDSELLPLTKGEKARPVSLQLLLRTVADVGFVGFPNAGKSTLLGALTRATAEVAPYPFTTLMPQLGAMMPAAGSTPLPGEAAPVGAPDVAAPPKQTPPPVLADLPGLVEGAHKGKGLGRHFLQQLRRVRLVLFILDSTSEDPPAKEQYTILRRELGLYNPQYLDRPHIVVLNKLDVALQNGGPAAFDQARTSLRDAILAEAVAASEQTAPPLAIVPISGLRGKGLRMLTDAINRALASLEAE